MIAQIIATTNALGAAGEFSDVASQRLRCDIDCDVTLTKAGDLLSWTVCDGDRHRIARGSLNY